MLSRMEKYHNKKSKSLKKGLTTALMGTVLASPLVLSTSKVNADDVAASSQSTQTVYVANSVEVVKQQMQAQGLNLNDVDGNYVVRQGDTLSAISIAAHESMQQIANDNNITNLNLIYVGQVLHLHRTVAAPALSNSYVLGTSGNGTKVAQAPQTSEQVQADKLVNQGFKPNASASFVSNGFGGVNTNSSVNTQSNSSSHNGVSVSNNNTSVVSGQKQSQTVQNSSNANTQKPSQAAQSSNSVQGPVVTSNGEVNYQAAMNEKGNWTSAQAWQQSHPNAQMVTEGYADGSRSQTPWYVGTDQDAHQNFARPALTQQQLNDANNAMQRDTSWNGVQWVGTNYNGEKTGGQWSEPIDNPVNTPYENYTDHIGQIDSNSIKHDITVPGDAHYVSSYLTNGTASDNVDGCNTNVAHIQFYK